MRRAALSLMPLYWLILPLLATLPSGCARQVDLATIKPGPDGLISWEDAQQVLLHSDVKSVMQNHALDVWISLKTGTEYKTKEPQIDAVWHFIKDHGLERQISYATE